MRWMVVGLLGFVATGLRAETPLRFSGFVSAGQSFSKPIGRGLTFELEPDDGWDIRIRRSSGEDMTRCVTFPLHGTTALQIMAWKFLPAAGEKAWERTSEHAHRFDFTLNSADQKRSCDELEVIARPPQKDPETGVLTVGTPGYRLPPMGHGDMVVTKIQFSPAAGRRATAIENMRFAVEVWNSH